MLLFRFLVLMINDQRRLSLYQRCELLSELAAFLRNHISQAVSAIPSVAGDRGGLSTSDELG